MHFLSIWPLLPVTALAFIFVSLPFFRILDKPPAAHERSLNALDGLRGFLAIGVVFGHLASRYYLEISGHNTWELPPSHFYQIFEDFSVAEFFIMTGFLFWGKCMDMEENFSWLRFYTHRFFRIVPLYLLIVVLYWG